MNANTELSLSRRSMLQSTGALVVSFSLADIGPALAADVAPAAPAGRPPLLPTELDFPGLRSPRTVLSLSISARSMAVRVPIFAWRKSSPMNSTFR